MDKNCLTPKHYFLGIELIFIEYHFKKETLLITRLKKDLMNYHFKFFGSSQTISCLNTIILIVKQTSYAYKSISRYMIHKK